MAWRSWNEGPLPIKLPGWYWDLWGWAGLDSARWQLVVLEAFVCVEPSKSWWWYMLASKHPQGNTEPSPPEEVQGNLLEAHICRVSETVRSVLLLPHDNTWSGVSVSKTRHTGPYALLCNQVKEPVILLKERESVPNLK